MKYVNRLTREIENHLPDFTSYEEARSFFAEKFGEQFTDLISVYEADGKCFEHHVVVSPIHYYEGRKKIEERTFDYGGDNMDYMMSYHPVQIMENGHVHIVY